MKIVNDIDAIGSAKWQHFVEQHPSSTFFHSPTFFKAFSNSPHSRSHFIAVCNADDEIIAISVFLILSEPGRLKSYFSRRAISMAAPLVLANDEHVLKTLLQAQNKFLKTRAIYQELRNVSFDLRTDAVFQQEGFSPIEHLNIILDLNQSEKDLYKSLSSSSRNKIKIAQNSGMEFRTVDVKAEMQSVYALIQSVYSRVKLPLFSFADFKQAVLAIQDENNLWAVGVYSKQELMSVMLLSSYKQELYSWYMASARGNKAKGATDLLVWELIKKAKQEAFQRFDWGGAGMPEVDYSVRNFKMKFGGEICEDRRYRIVYQPLIYRLSAFALSLIRGK